MILKFFKKVDCLNKILLPKCVIEKFGREYFMEVYEDKIILRAKE